MPRQRVTVGACPQCGADELVCSYNYFSSDDLTIDAWEHKCADCGFRETVAYRSDDDDVGDDVDPRCCPFCQRRVDPENL